MPKIATWNVNSIKQRVGHLAQWMQSAKPDVVLLQELKCADDAMPLLELRATGYHIEFIGQKAYNGVAILSRHEITDIQKGLPGDEEDTQSRYIEATTAGLRVASIYLPNGNPVDSEKFPYKLSWMQRLYDRAAELLESEAPVVLGGDYNCAPRDEDVFDPKRFANDALCRPETRNAFRAILNLGYTEAFRALDSQPHVYSYWDYGAAFRADDGLRIDHLLLSPQAADRLEACRIDKEPRGWERSSDHTPVVCELAA